MGVPEGQRPTDAQFVQQLMLSLLGMACFTSERMLEWAAEAFDWFGAALMPNPVRDCCLIRTNIVCIRVGPYCISICTRQVNPLYFLYCDPKLHGFCLKWRYADYAFLENLEAPCRRRSCAVAVARRRVPDWGFIGT